MAALRPAPKVWDAELEIWKSIIGKSWNGSEWAVPPGDYTFAYRTPFYPDYIGDGSVLKRSVASMPLHSNSEVQAQWMADNVNYGDGFGDTAFNTSSGGTHPIACYVVDSSIGSTDFVYMTSDVFYGATDYDREILTGWVPWPTWVDESTLQPSQDSAIAIYDIGTGIFREFYFVTRIHGYKNKFHANTGGYTIYPKGLLRLGDFNPSLQLSKGSSAVVRMHNHLGWVDVAGARRGIIDHALAFTCANMAKPDSIGEAIDVNGNLYDWKGASWPALSGDGDTVPVGDNVPIHGQWARLPADYVTSGFKPFLRMVLEAVKTYGMFCSDSNNFVHAFNGEPAFPYKHFGGVDPWSLDDEGDVALQWHQANIDQGFGPEGSPFDLSDFPWADTQWAPRNWGKPGVVVLAE